MEKLLDKENRHKNITLGIIFILLIFLNFLTIQVSDDMGYSIHSGFLDILSREYVQYMTWTGRTVAHIIARIFLALPKWFFNIFNSLCFLYLCKLIYFHAKGRKIDLDTSLYVMIVCVVFLFVPFFGQTILWETGSSNYLWTTTIALHFLSYYRFGIEIKNRFVFVLKIFVLGVLSGWTNENTGGVVILFILFQLVLKRIKKAKIERWKYIGLFGSIFGFLLLILAPGNKIRANDFIHTEGIAYQLMHDLTSSLNVFMKDEVIMWIAFALLIAYAIYKNKRDIIFHSIIYAICSISAVLAICISPVPVLYDRSMFSAAVFLIIAIVILFDEIDMEFKPLFIKLSLGLLVLFSTEQYLRAILDLSYTTYQSRIRQKYIREQIAYGNTNPTVPQINREFETKYNALHGLNDITEYKDYWVNTTFATANGLSSISSTPWERWEKIYKTGSPKLMNILDYNEYLKEISNPKYITLITSSSLDVEKYHDYLSQLNSIIGIKLDRNFIAVINLHGENYINTAETFVSDNFTIADRYCYIASSDKGIYSDINIDEIEYSNDNDGITFVVLDAETGRVLDSITFNIDNKFNGIRYFKYQKG